MKNNRSKPDIVLLLGAFITLGVGSKSIIFRYSRFERAGFDFSTTGIPAFIIGILFFSAGVKCFKLLFEVVKEYFNSLIDKPRYIFLRNLWILSITEIIIAHYVQYYYYDIINMSGFIVLNMLTFLFFVASCGYTLVFVREVEIRGEFKRINE